MYRNKLPSRNSFGIGVVSKKSLEKYVQKNWKMWVKKKINGKNLEKTEKSLCPKFTYRSTPAPSYRLFLIQIFIIQRNVIL